MTDRTPRNRAARAAACAVLTLGVAATGYALPAPAHPALFARLFPAADAEPIRVRAALTNPDTVPVYDISQVDRKPSLRDPGNVTIMLQRAYPAHLHDTGIGGTVLVELVVQPNGSVRQARVVNTTRPEFQEPARTVALGMRFVPAEKNGSPVGVRLQIPITFRPEDAAVTLVTPGAPVELSRTVDTVRTVTVDTVVVPAGADPAQLLSAAARASGARVEAVTVPSRRTTTRVDTVLIPATTTGEVLPASAGISTRGWTPTRSTAPTRARMAPTRGVTAAPVETTTLVTTAPTRATSRGATTARTTTAPTRATSRGADAAQTTVLTTTVPTRATSRGATTARTITAAPTRAVTAAPTTTVTTTARATKAAPARIAPVTGRAPRPARARKVDPTPELLGRVIDPNAPRKPPAPAPAQP